MVKLSYTNPALADLQHIFVYISNDSVISARRLVHTLKERIKTLKTFPEKGRPLFGQKHPGIRQVLYRSYRIIYKHDGENILILVITHQSRLISNIEAIKQYLI